jgi:protein-S-isoprenylcysteine O-methyltransferase Ste14
MGLVRTLLYIPPFVTVFYVLLPAGLLTIEGKSLLDVRHAWVLLPAAPLCLFGLWACWELGARGRGTPIPLDPTRRLVTTGPYAWVRNPIQISGIGAAACLAVLYESPLISAYAVVLALIVEFVFDPFEDWELARRFGSEWIAYRGRVRRWVPNKLFFWKPGGIKAKVRS